jgi:DNA polymerase III alpha subunit (gram-positive type)
MIAHNAPFDVGFISYAMEQRHLPPPPHPVLDTWPLARRRLQLPNYKLETIGRSLGLIERKAHGRARRHRFAQGRVATCCASRRRSKAKTSYSRWRAHSGSSRCGI